MISIAANHEQQLHPRICVIGVGGGGGNAVANMMRSGVQGVDFIVANTDAQALKSSISDQRVQLGRTATQGLGAGAEASVGRAAAVESLDEINRALEGAHMCFIAAGLGGGTGTGAAPIIAAAARAKGILTVGVVTKPFGFEGRRRAAAADAGIAELEKHVDTLIVIPNQNLFRIASPSTTFREAFKMADDVLEQGVRSISDLIVMPGIINLDFADVRSVMEARGKAMLGTGEATGTDRAVRAAEFAISNPLLDGTVKGAKGLIVSITGGEDMLLMEIDEAANHIKELVDPEADIIWGSAFDAKLAGRIRVSIVVTGIECDAVLDSRPVPEAAAVTDQPADLIPAVKKAMTAPQLEAAPEAIPFMTTQPILSEEEPAPRAGPGPSASPDWSKLWTAEAAAAPVPTSDFRNAEQMLMLFEDAAPVAAPLPSSSVSNDIWLRTQEGKGMSLFQRMSALARGPKAPRISALPGPAYEEPGVYRRNRAMAV